LNLAAPDPDLAVETDDIVVLGLGVRPNAGLDERRTVDGPRLVPEFEDGRSRRLPNRPDNPFQSDRVADAVLQ